MIFKYLLCYSQKKRSVNYVAFRPDNNWLGVKIGGLLQPVKAVPEDVCSRASGWPPKPVTVSRPFPRN